MHILRNCRDKTIETVAVVTIFGGFGLLLFLSLTGCERKRAEEQVVIYTSLDKVFSQPVLETFEKETGIKVRAVYDSEATKTTGLVNRLIAAYPKSIFSAHAQTMLDSLPTAE